MEPRHVQQVLWGGWGGGGSQGGRGERGWKDCRLRRRIQVWGKQLCCRCRRTPCAPVSQGLAVSICCRSHKSALSTTAYHVTRRGSRERATLWDTNPGPCCPRKEKHYRDACKIDFGDKGSSIYLLVACARERQAEVLARLHLRFQHCTISRHSGVCCAREHLRAVADAETDGIRLEDHVVDRQCCRPST